MAEIKNKIRNTAPSLAELQKKRQELVDSLTQQMAQPQAMQPQAAQPTANIGKKTAVGPKQALTPAADPAGMLLASAGQQGSGTGSKAAFVEQYGAKDPWEALDSPYAALLYGGVQQTAKPGGALTYNGGAGSAARGGETRTTASSGGGFSGRSGKLPGSGGGFSGRSGKMWLDTDYTPDENTDQATKDLVEERERLLQQLKDNKFRPIGLSQGAEADVSNAGGIYDRLHQIDAELGMEPQVYGLNDRVANIFTSTAERQGANYTEDVGSVMSPRGLVDTSLTGVSTVLPGFGTVQKGAMGLLDKVMPDWWTQTPDRLKGAQQKVYDTADALDERSKLHDAQARTGAGFAGNLAVDLSEGAIDLAADALANTIVPGSGMALMGARSYGSGHMEARQKGLDEHQQVVSGTKSAAIEVMTEQIGGPFEKIYGKSLFGKWTKDLTAKISSRAGQKAVKLLADAGMEAVQEGLSSVSNAVADRLLGLTDEGWGFLKDPAFWSQVAYESFVGFCLGAGGGAVDVARGDGDQASMRQRAEETALQAAEQTIREWKGEVATAPNEMTVRSGSAEDATGGEARGAGTDLDSARSQLIESYRRQIEIKRERQATLRRLNEIGRDVQGKTIPELEESVARLEQSAAEAEAQGDLKKRDGRLAALEEQRGILRFVSKGDRSPETMRAREEEASSLDAEIRALEDKIAALDREAAPTTSAPAPSPAETLAQAAQGQTSPQEAAGTAQSTAGAETAPTTQTSGTEQTEVFNSGSAGTETAQGEDEDARYHRIVSEQAERLPDLIHDTTWKQAKGIVEKEARRIWKALHPYGPSFKSIQVEDRSSVFSTYLMAMGVEITDEEIPMEAYSVGEDLAAHSGVEGYGLVSPFAAAAAVRDYLNGNTDKGANYIDQRAAWIDQQAKKRNGTELAYRDGEARAMARQAGNQPELVALARSIDKSGEAEWYAESIMRPLTELLRDGHVSDYGNEFLRLANGFSSSNDGSEDIFHVYQTLDLHSIEADENATKRFASFINAVAFGVEDTAASDNAGTEQVRKEKPMSSSPAQVLADVANGSQGADTGEARAAEGVGPYAEAAGAGTPSPAQTLADVASGRSAETSEAQPSETAEPETPAQPAEPETAQPAQVPAEQAPAQPAQPETAPAQAAQQSGTAEPEAQPARPARPDVKTELPADAPEGAKLSRYWENTLQRVEEAGQAPDEVKQPLWYMPKSEVQSLAEAASRLSADRQGTVEDLTEAEAWSGVQHDAAIQISDDLFRQSKKSGDWRGYAAWRKVMQQHMTETARGLQSAAKRTRNLGQTAIENAVDVLEDSDLPKPVRNEVTNEVAKYADELDAIEPGDLASLRDLIKRMAQRRGNWTILKGSMDAFLDHQDEDFLREAAFRQLEAFPRDAMNRGGQNLAGKAASARVLAMLGGLPTIGRNLEGNTTFSLLDLFSARVGGSVVDSLLGKATGQRTVVGSRAMAHKTVPAWFKNAWANMERSMLETALDISTDESDSRPFDMPANSAFVASGGPIEKLFQRFSQIMGYGLVSTDRFFRGGIEGGELANYEAFDAKRGAKGKQGTGLSQEERTALARNTADYRLFQNRTWVSDLEKTVRRSLDNAVGVGGEKVAGKRTKDNTFGLGSALMPFVEVPTNIALKPLEYGPGNLAKGLFEIAQLVRANNINQKLDPADRASTAELQQRAAMDTARGLSGTAFMLLATVLAKMGLTRNGDDEEDYDVAAVNKLKGQNGTQWNIDATLRALEGRSADWKETDLLVGMGGISPLDLFLNAGTKFAQLPEVERWTDNIGPGVSAYLQAMISSMSDVPMFQAMGEFEQTVRDADSITWETGADLAGDLVDSTVSSFLPQVLKNSVRASDSYYRDTSADSWGQERINNVMQYLPWLRQKLPEQIDSFGEKKEQADARLRWLNGLVSPNPAARYQTTAVIRELEALREESGKDSFYPDRKAPKKVSIPDTEGTGNEDYELNTEEKRAYQETYGKAYTRVTAALFKSSEWAGMDTATKLKAIAEAESFAKDEARKALAESLGRTWESDWDEERGLDQEELGRYIATRAAFKTSIANGKYSAVDALLDTVYWKSPDVVDLLLDDVPQMAKRVEAREAGIPSMLWQEAKDKYTELGDNEDLTPQQRAEQFSKYLSEQPWLSDDQRDVLREQFKFYQMNPANTKHYDALTAAGFDPDKAIDLRERVAALEPLGDAKGVKQWQEVEAIVTMKGLTDEEKWTALEEYLDKDTYAKVKAYRERGMDPDDWAAQYIAAKKK